MRGDPLTGDAHLNIAVNTFNYGNALLNTRIYTINCKSFVRAIDIVLGRAISTKQCNYYV